MKKTLNLILVLVILVSTGSIYNINKGFNLFSKVIEANENEYYDDTVENLIESVNDYDVIRINDDKYGTRYLGGYYEYKYSHTITYNDKYLGVHPNFSASNPLYSDGYYFSTTNDKRFSASVSVGVKFVSVSFNVDASSSVGSGYFRSASSSRKSLPYIRADLKVKFYDMYIYDDYGKLLAISRDYYTQTTTSDRQIFIKYF